MSIYVVDTQALIKLLTGVSEVISPEIDDILRDADLGAHTVVVSAVVTMEVAYLYEKGRIPISVDSLQNLFANAVNYVEGELTTRIIQAAFEITDIPELHDRLIAGTARLLRAPILTNDPVIRASKYVTCI